MVAVKEVDGAGGIEDNIATSVNIGLINPDLTGNNLSYQLGNVVTPITIAGSSAPGITFPYALANGTTFSSLANLKAAYNYLPLMYQLYCTSFSNCIPLQGCSVNAGGS